MKETNRERKNNTWKEIDRERKVTKTEIKNKTNNEPSEKERKKYRSK